ncbi:hypothetical protein [Psychroflexus aestuariivivens]|uniref:hypothetical protein n=1 Tax=Psychroflexus aestuariivivens TaxID=1795040 RepID=UPI000FD9A2AF|nr:hypothetical protein [Psychroflexus aestuariivivens]
MKKALSIFIILASMSIMAQEVNEYKYVIVPMKYDFQSEQNQFQLNVLTRVLLQDEGFEVFMDVEDKPLQLQRNPCQALTAEVNEMNSFLSKKVIVKLKDCFGKVVFETEEGVSRKKSFKEAYQEALKDAFNSFSKLNYKFDKALKMNSDSSEKSENLYPNKIIYKFGGEEYWLIKTKSGFKLLADEGKTNYAELKNADKGTFIFNSRSFDGAAYFNPNGDFSVEYMDEDINEIQTLIFKKVK